MVAYSMGRKWVVEEDSKRKMFERVFTNFEKKVAVVCNICRMPLSIYEQEQGDHCEECARSMR